ncbi:MAG: DUF1338 domain-containing protein [Planctomycetota bacterium]
MSDAAGTSADQFFDALWADYVAMAPQAGRIQAAFQERGEVIVNDHVAFRTLALEPIGLEALEPHLLALGYERFAPYEFPAKKLRAYGYLHPTTGAGGGDGTRVSRPRVFLSELLTDQLSADAQAILRRCAGQVDATRVGRPDIFWAGRLWDPISWDEYQMLAAESEYAAWMATIGIRPNHFTISVTDLVHHTSVEQVLGVVEGLGYAVNASGGRVKGSPEVLLEQGSTLADEMPMPFAGGETHPAPTCYYEFAKRYPQPDGQLFQGFVAASADKIFESTDKRGG